MELVVGQTWGTFTQASDEGRQAPLPAQKGFFLRIWAHENLRLYDRIAFMVLACNLIFVFKNISILNYQLCNNLALVNLTLALLIRQPYFLNFLFWMATRTPVSWPLAIRSKIGKLYHISGIHFGGLIAGTVWQGLSLWELFKLSDLAPSLSFQSILALGVVRFSILMVLSIASGSDVRIKHHDFYERVEHFGGWASLILLLGQIGLFLKLDGVYESLSLIPYWHYVAIFLLVLNAMQPWLTLKKVRAVYQKPSSHVALVQLDYGVTPMTGSTVTISRTPWLEWHPFAAIPTPGQSGYRMAISRAGDWTSSFIDEMPEHVWVKSIPVPAVGRISPLFKRVVYVATGSGIGPVFPT